MSVLKAYYTTGNEEFDVNKTQICKTFALFDSLSNVDRITRCNFLQPAKVTTQSIAKVFRDKGPVTSHAGPPLGEM